MSEWKTVLFLMVGVMGLGFCGRIGWMLAGHLLRDVIPDVMVEIVNNFYGAVPGEDPTSESGREVGG